MIYRALLLFALSLRSCALLFVHYSFCIIINIIQHNLCERICNLNETGCEDMRENNALRRGVKAG